MSIAKTCRHIDMSMSCAHENAAVEKAPPPGVSTGLRLPGVKPLKNIACSSGMASGPSGHAIASAMHAALDSKTFR